MDGRTLLRAALLVAVWLVRGQWALEFRHHRHEDLVQVLSSVHNMCPYITRLYSIGRSANGRHLYVIEFSDNPGIHEARKSAGPPWGGNKEVGVGALASAASDLPW